MKRLLPLALFAMLVASGCGTPRAPKRTERQPPLTAEELRSQNDAIRRALPLAGRHGVFAERVAILADRLPDGSLVVHFGREDITRKIEWGTRHMLPTGDVYIRGGRVSERWLTPALPDTAKMHRLTKAAQAVFDRELAGGYVTGFTLGVCEQEYGYEAYVGDLVTTIGGGRKLVLDRNFREIERELGK